MEIPATLIVDITDYIILFFFKSYKLVSTPKPHYFYSTDFIFHPL